MSNGAIVAGRRGRLRSSVPGNPKNIHNWNDLTQPGLQILTPDPSQSGGARWNIVAASRAAMRGEVPGYAKEQHRGRPERLLEGIFKNVTVLDKSANDSLLKVPRPGNGDVAITYDYQVRIVDRGGAGGRDRLAPPSTVFHPDADGGRGQCPLIVSTASSPSRTCS